MKVITCYNDDFQNDYDMMKMITVFKVMTKCLFFALWNNRHVTRDLIGCGSCLITAYSTRKTDFSVASCQPVFYKRNRKFVRCVVCGYNWSTRGFVRTLEKCWESLRSASRVLTYPRVLYNCTQHSGEFSISFMKYRLTGSHWEVSFARAVGSYKTRATANQIARNMSIIS
jgi:hypothetical protein